MPIKQRTAAGGAVTDAHSDVDDATKANTTAQNALTSAKADTTAAQANVTTAQNAVDTAQAALDAANSANTSSSDLASQGITVSVNAAAKAAAQNLATRLKVKDQTTINTDLPKIAAGITITYKPTTADWNSKITGVTADMNGVIGSSQYDDVIVAASASQKSQLTNIIVDIYNSIRTQLGLPEVTNYTSMTDAAANTSKRGNMSFDLEGGAMLFGGYFPAVKQSNGTVDWSTSKKIPAGAETQWSMALVKDGLLNYGGLSSGSFDAGALQVLLGFTTTTGASKALAYDVDLGATTSITAYTVTDTDAIKSTSTTDSSALKTALANAQSTLTDAQSKLATAQSNQSKAQTEANSTASALASEKTAYTNAQTTQKTASDAVTTATTKLSDAKSKLTNAETSLSNAQTALKASQQDSTAKQATLEAAKAALSEAQQKKTDADNNLANAKTALDAANATLKSDQSKLDAAKTVLTDTQTKLADAKSAQQTLADAPAKLEAAKQTLADAQSKLADAQSALEDAKAAQANYDDILANAKEDTTQAKTALDAAKAVTAAAQSKLNTAKAELKQAQDAETLAEQVARQQHKIESEAAAKQNGYHVDGSTVKDNQGSTVSGWSVKNGKMVDAYSNIIADTTTPKQTVAKSASRTTAGQQTTAAVSARKTQQAVAKITSEAMPQTGDANESGVSVVGLAIIALLGGLGLAERKRRTH